MGYQDFDHLFQEFQNGDEIASGFIWKLESEIKNGVWNLSVIFKQDVIVLSGGLSRNYFGFLRETISELMKDQNEDFINPFEILSAGRDINPALPGANLILEC